MLWTANDLVAATEGVMISPFDAGGVSIDTRTLHAGELFVALIGDNGDGHEHVAKALAAGAAGALVHRDPPGVPHAANLLRVADTLAALAALGRFARSRFEGRLIAVTGSVGKTTTKEMLRAILAAAGPTLAAEASYNNQWGVPLTLARLPAAARFCVDEIGMNHAGEIEPLARLARPHVALITTIERVHIGHLGSIEAIAEEKATILAGLEPGGIAVLPADSPYLPILIARAGGARVVAFGASPRAEARLIAADIGADGGTVVTAEIGGRRVSTRLAAPGLHMAMNAVAALAGADALGVSPQDGAAALAGFAPLAGRGACRAIAVADGRATLLDESYNASQVSVRAALDVLRRQRARRRVVVLGDMLEMGEHASAEHLGLLPDLVSSADLVFACGPMARQVFDALPARLRGVYAENSAALAPAVVARLRADDAVLVKGSLGMRMRTIVDALTSGERPG